MARPVIGLSCYLEPSSWGAWHEIGAVIHVWYLDIVQSAGGTVVCIPPDPKPDLDLLDRIDGLILAGGADVDSRLYGEDPHEMADTPRMSRDASEIALSRHARIIGMPTLGICRGLQVMAVAHGGALHQDLPDVSTLVHRQRPGEFVDHGATFMDGSAVARALGTQAATVNSSHHQSVRDAGDLVVTGWASDGTIEACEDPEHPFYLGVQWHPETPVRRQVDAGLVNALVTAATTFRS